MEAEIHSTASTPTPPMPGSTTRILDSDGGAVVKDENGQEISCVVCSDKSSGKHYGQYTCEGNASLILVLSPLYLRITRDTKPIRADLYGSPGSLKTVKRLPDLPRSQ